jgi:hypothetical protein
MDLDNSGALSRIKSRYGANMHHSNSTSAYILQRQLVRYFKANEEPRNGLAFVAIEAKLLKLKGMRLQQGWMILETKGARYFIEQVLKLKIPATVV